MARSSRPGTTSLARPPGPIAVDGDSGATSRTVLWMELHRTYAVAQDGHQVAVDVVRVIGEVDLTTAGQLATALVELIARPAAQVVVDTTGMTFCGLRGLGALHDAARLAAAQHAGFAIVGLSPQLDRLARGLWPAPHPTLCPDRAGAVTQLVADAPPRPQHFAHLPESSENQQPAESGPRGRSSTPRALSGSTERSTPPRPRSVRRSL